ncbi:MAG: hypothetical protein ACI8W7_000001 [Gammaproteobacteria bacterium]
MRKPLDNFEELKKLVSENSLFSEFSEQDLRSFLEIVKEAKDLADGEILIE